MVDEAPPAASQSQRRQAPKLRLSCDNCSHAKVRCGQERPACQRCVSARAQCIYSVSRRIGKPPKLERHANNSGNVKDSNSRINGNDNDGTKKASLRTSTVSIQTDNLPELPISTRFPSSDGERTLFSQLKASATLDSYYPDFGLHEVGTNSSGFFSGRLLSISSDTSLNDQNYFGTVEGNDSSRRIPQGQNFSTKISPVNGVEVWDPNTNGSFPIGSALTDSAPTDSGMSSPGASVDDPFHMLGSASTRRPVFDSAQSNGSTCGHFVSNMIYNLSLPFSFCTIFPSSVQPSIIDKVLDTSRQAMTAVHNLLQCPCSQESSSAISLALVILKILDSYCAIMRSSPSFSSTANLQPAPTSENKSHSIPASSPSTQSLGSQSTQSMVLDTPITIGAYKIDAGDEQRFILQLLWIELRKVGRLVEAFAARYAASNMGTNKRNGEGVACRGCDVDFSGQTWDSAEESIYIALEQFMRAKIYSARREVNMALSRSDDSAMEFSI
jgi:hypothetical protein